MDIGKIRNSKFWRFCVFLIELFLLGMVAILVTYGFVEAIENTNSRKIAIEKTYLFLPPEVKIVITMDDYLALQAEERAGLWNLNGS